MAEVVKLLTIQTSMVDSEGPKHEASSWNLGAERNEHVELRAAHTLELHGHMLLDDLDMPKTSQQRVKNLYNIGFGQNWDFSHTSLLHYFSFLTFQIHHISLSIKQL